MRPRLILLLPLLLLLHACTPRVSAPPRPPSTGVDIDGGRPVLVAGEEPQVRILLARSVNAMKIESPQSVEIYDAKGRRLIRLKGRRVYHLFQDPKHPEELRIFESVHGGRSLEAEGKIPLETGTRLVPGSASFELNGKRYRGSLRLIRRGSHFTCVNHLPMEEYLRGVVPHEIGHLGRDGYEAMKVQAVASRTYAVQRLRESRGAEWDMVDTIYDQVYEGAGSWEPADRAIRATRGELVALGKEPAEVYYSSTCGGHTADIGVVWNHAGAPHMEGVRDADALGRSWCRSSRYFRWTHSWSAAELGRIFRSYLPGAAGLPAGTRIGRLRDVRILEYSPEGRVQVLEVVSDQGRFQVRGDRVRTAMKRNMSGLALRSTMFRLGKEYDEEGRLVRVMAHGAGWGHGIGLCQVGAIERSKAGQDYREILKAYFPGTTIRRFWP